LNESSSSQQRSIVIEGEVTREPLSIPRQVEIAEFSRSIDAFRASDAPLERSMPTGTHVDKYLITSGGRPLPLALQLGHFLVSSWFPAD